MRDYKRIKNDGEINFSARRETTNVNVKYIGKSCDNEISVLLTFFLSCRNDQGTSDWHSSEKVTLLT